MTTGTISTLLVIEDNPGDARLLREMLGEPDQQRVTVIQVESLGAAEDHLAANIVDVILLDLGLPDAQGLEAVRRTHAAAPLVPLVILTGLDDELLAAQALQVGAQDYLIKGQIEPRGLSRALRYAVERNRLDTALFAEKERAHVTLDSIGDAVASTDLAGQIAYLNAVGQTLTGWSLAEARSQSIATVLNLHDALTGEPIMLDDQLPTPAGPVDLPPRSAVFCRDGREIAIEGCLAPIHQQDGRRAGAVIVFRDVSERRVAERATRRSEERFDRLFAANTIGIRIADLEGRTLEANAAYLDMLGYTLEEIIVTQSSWNALTPPEYHERNGQAVAQLLATGVAQPWEKEYLRKDGTRVPVLVGLALLEATEGTCISYIVDLSERHLLEDQLRQAQKMEAIGQIAGGVAHDFSNLLTVILGHANLMADQLTELDPIRGSAEEIIDAGNRAGTMTRQLLAFSRRQVLEPEVLDVNAVLSDLERLLRRMLGESVELRTELLPEGGRVLADASQLEQVLMNLAVNARDAMPRGGSLTIALGEAMLDGHHPPDLTGLPAGRYVTIAVRDSGIGMSPETRAHLFEPFFTTKDRDKGTGLGLATAYGVIKQSGGSITVVSELGRGATFTIYLPRLDAEIAQSAGAAAAPVRPQATQTLLLVEDEAAVRRLTRRILEDRGYRVLEAADGEAALEVARQHAGPIHLLLTDVVMPGLSGRDLGRRIAAIRAETSIVYMSGYPDDDLLHNPSAAGVFFVQKPFTADALAAKLREAMGVPAHPVLDPAQARAMPSNRENSARTIA
jgi:PAS domain S-box-containing protein